MTTTPSTTTAHPDQLLLPGQAAAPGGPADMTMMYVMHHAFRRDLGRFADAVAATPLDDRTTWKALAARWDRFFEILHHHHAAEDELIWPFLMERADATEQETLEAMEDPGATFRVAVQWHPEAGEDPRLFEALVAAAAAYRQRS